MDFKVFLSQLEKQKHTLEEKIYHTKKRMQRCQSEKDFDMRMLYKNFEEEKEKRTLEQLIQEKKILDTIIVAAKDTVESLEEN